MSFGHCGIDWLHSLLDCNRQILILPELSFYRYWKILDCDNAIIEKDIIQLWMNHFRRCNSQSLDVKLMHNKDEETKVKVALNDN